MEHLVIDGVPPYDGRYLMNLADQELTTREWGWIKRLSGYQPLTASDGLATNDAELVCAIAVILLRRAGRIGNDDVPAAFERIADAPYTATLQWEKTGVERPVKGDAEDPTESSNGNASFAGPGSSRSSESSGEPSSPTGTPDSATSVSDPPTSVS